MGKITKYLNQLIDGNVFDAPEILEAYATDQSALKIKPKFVAFPESTEDIQKLMRFFNEVAKKDLPLSVTVRGSGLDEGGADLSNSVVISTEKINKLLEIDPRERLVRVQSGMTIKELNTALSVSGLTIPIKGHENETIGGLIANCPIDDYAEKYGGIARYVERIEVILANGECLQTTRLRKYAVAKKAAEKTFEGRIYQKTAKIFKKHEALIDQLREREVKDFSGYATVTKVMKKDTTDLMPLFFGAQGTLGIVTEVILRAEPMKKKAARVAATFKNLETAEMFIQENSHFKPREANIFDLRIIQEARETGKNLDGVIKKLENGFMVIMSFDEKQNSCMKKIANAKNRYPKSTKIILESPENASILNELENSLTNYLNHTKNAERIPILTDFYLPPQNLHTFLQDIKIIEEKLNLDLALYGSRMTSIYNLRPKFTFEDKDFNKQLATFLRAGAYVINRQGGRLAGGGAEGRIKAIVTNEEMGESEKKLYLEIKQVFDENNILNPDIKLGATSKFTLTHLRSSALPKILI